VRAERSARWQAVSIANVRREVTPAQKSPAPTGEFPYQHVTFDYLSGYSYQCGLVFALMTLELGLVLPLKARTR